MARKAQTTSKLLSGAAGKISLTQEQKDGLTEVWSKLRNTPQSADNILLALLTKFPQTIGGFSNWTEMSDDELQEDGLFQLVSSKMLRMFSKFFRTMNDETQFELYMEQLVQMRDRWYIKQAMDLPELPEAVVEAVGKVLPEGLSPQVNEALLSVFRDIQTRMKHQD